MPEVLTHPCEKKDTQKFSEKNFLIWRGGGGSHAAEHSRQNELHSYSFCVMGPAQKKFIANVQTLGIYKLIAVGVLLAGSAYQLLLLGPLLVPICTEKGRDDAEMHHVYATDATWRLAWEWGLLCKPELSSCG